MYHFWYILNLRGEINKTRRCRSGFKPHGSWGAPVLDWLRGLGKEDRRAVGLDLMRVQFGWPIGRPLVASLKDGLWEVRSSLPSQRIARLILCFHDESLVVLHGFIKKHRKRLRMIWPWRSGE
jgi:phage-related protein